MAGEIVQDDDVAWRQRRREDLLDIGAEGVAVHRAVEDQRGDEAAECAGAATSVVVFQWPCGTAATGTLRPRRAAVAARHVGGGPGLVDEDEPFRVELGWQIAPGLARAPLTSGRSCSAACSDFF